MTTTNAIPVPRQSTYTMASKALMRYWVSQLQLAEIRVLSFIIDRTLPFGDTWKTVRIADMIEGKNTPSYEIYGVNLSKSQILRALKSLEKTGLIIKRKCQNYVQSNQYSVVTNVLFGGVEGMSKLKISKADKLKNDVNTLENHKKVGLENSTEKGGVGVTHDTFYKAIEQDKEKEKNRQSAHAQARTREPGILEVIENTKNKIIAKREAKAKTASATSSVEEIRAAWISAVREALPDLSVPAITVTDARILRKNLSNVNLPIPLLDFLIFSVDNWQTLIENQFGYRTKFPAPKVPTASFLARNVNAFLKFHGSFRADHFEHKSLQSIAKNAKTENTENTENTESIEELNELRLKNEELQARLAEEKKERERLAFLFNRSLDTIAANTKEIKRLKSLIEHRGVDPSQLEDLPDYEDLPG